MPSSGFPQFHLGGAVNSEYPDLSSEHLSLNSEYPELSSEYPGDAGEQKMFTWGVQF